MAGAQRIRGSLQFKLSLWLSAAIVAFAAVAGGFSFFSAYEEAIELQDDQLRHVADVVAALEGQPRAPRIQGYAETGGHDARDDDWETRLQVQHLPPRPGDGAQDRRLDLPPDIPNGFATRTLDGVSWRLFTVGPESGERLVVAQPTAIREEIASGGGWRTILPLLGLIPVLLLLAGLMIRRMFKPLRTMAAELDRRSDSDLGALDKANLPSEIVPFVVALDRLLGRVDQAMAMQRRFVADASHELRTPLTALSLQAEGLAEAELPPGAAQRLAVLRQGLARAHNLVAQLLALARARDGHQDDRASVELKKIVREVLEELWPLAEAKNVDLGVVGEIEGRVHGGEVDLRAMVKNLVDNAVRYTPAGGRVDLSAHRDEGGLVFQVDDTGPGIPPEERRRVFDPFHRVLGSGEVGSGLGLSIVAAVAERLKARVELEYACGQTGLRVRVIFPKEADGSEVGMV